MEEDDSTFSLFLIFEGPSSRNRPHLRVWLSPPSFSWSILFLCRLPPLLQYSHVASSPSSRLELPPLRMASIPFFFGRLYLWCCSPPPPPRLEPSPFGPSRLESCSFGSSPVEPPLFQTTVFLHSGALLLREASSSYSIQKSVSSAEATYKLVLKNVCY